MDCSTPGLPVPHHLPEFAQTHVLWVGDAMQPSHPLRPPSPPALDLSQHQGLFQWVSLCMRWPQWWETRLFLQPDVWVAWCLVGGAVADFGHGRKPARVAGNAVLWGLGSFTAAAPSDAGLQGTGVAGARLKASVIWARAPSRIASLAVNEKLGRPWDRRPGEKESSGPQCSDCQAPWIADEIQGWQGWVIGWKDLVCNLFAPGLSQTVGVAESLQGQATSVSPDSLDSSRSDQHGLSVQFNNHLPQVAAEI